MSRERHMSNRELIALVAMLMATAALSIDLILPAFDDIRAEFDLASDSAATAGLITVFLIGLAIPQIAYGPLSDRYGRKPMLFAGLGLFAVGAIGSAVAPSLEVMMVSRFLWGMGAGGPRVITLSIIRDTHEGERMARVMSFIMSIFILVPIVAPTVGAGLTAIFPWRSVFWFCAIYALVVAVWTLRLPETRKAEHTLALERRAIAAAMKQVFTNRQTVGYTLGLVAIGGVFLSYLASSERIWADVFDRDAQFPLIFGGIAIVFGLMLLTNGFIVGRLGMRRVAHSALVWYAVAAVAITTVSLSAGGTPGFWIFVVLLAFQLASQSFLIPNFNTLAMAPMANVAGTASALIGGISTAGAALLGAVIDNAFDGTVGPFATAFLLAAGAVVVIVSVTERGKLTWTGRAVPPEIAGAPPVVD